MFLLKLTDINLYDKVEALLRNKNVCCENTFLGKEPKIRN